MKLPLCMREEKYRAVLLHAVLWLMILTRPTKIGRSILCSTVCQIHSFVLPPTSLPNRQPSIRVSSGFLYVTLEAPCAPPGGRIPPPSAGPPVAENSTGLLPLAAGPAEIETRCAAAAAPTPTPLSDASAGLKSPSIVGVDEQVPISRAIVVIATAPSSSFETGAGVVDVLVDEATVGGAMTDEAVPTVAAGAMGVILFRLGPSASRIKLFTLTPEECVAQSMSNLVEVRGGGEDGRIPGGNQTQFNTFKFVTMYSTALFAQQRRTE